MQVLKTITLEFNLSVLQRNLCTCRVCSICNHRVVFFTVSHLIDVISFHCIIIVDIFGNLNIIIYLLLKITLQAYKELLDGSLKWRY